MKSKQQKLIETLNKTIEELQTYHFAVQLGKAHSQSGLDRNSKQYKLATNLNEQEKQSLRDSMDQLGRTIKVLQHVSFAESLNYDFGDESDIINFKKLYNMSNGQSSSTTDDTKTMGE